MSFYRLDVLGLASGHQIMNTLYYRDEDLSLATWIASPYARAAALVGAFYQSLVHDSDGSGPMDGNYWCAYLNFTYQLRGFRVSVRSEGLGFPAETSAPYEFMLPSPISGGDEGPTDGPDSVAIFRFGMTYQPATSGLYQPRRRNIRYGPVGGNNINNDGQLWHVYRSAVQANVADRLAGVVRGNATRYTNNLVLQALLEDITDFLAIGPSQVLADLDNIYFAPQAYGVRRVGGVIEIEGYSRVNTCTVQPYASRLRSRRTPPSGG